MMLLSGPVRKRSSRPRRIVEAAVEAAEREKQHRLADAAIEIESQIQLEPASRKWAVEGVVRCVCKQP